MRSTRTQIADLLFALLLYLPVGLFYGAHFAAKWNDPERIGSGFIQYDQPTYMACAREFIDGRSQGLFFALPGETDPEAKPALVQVHLWALSVVWRATDADPGVLFFLFGAVFAIATIYVSMRLFDHFVRCDGLARRIGQILFVWGGGVLCATGVIAAGVGDAELTARTLFEFDPGLGWWFMNLGRTFLFPNEAYYHFLFFCTLLFLVRGQHFQATVACTVLAWSHPFAGPQLLTVVLGWAFLERVVFKTGSPPWAVIAWWFLLAAVYAWYLFLWIPANAPPDLVSAIRDDFVIRVSSSIPAYFLVGLAAILRLRSRARWTSFIGVPGNRALLVMLGVCLFLENHELFFTPHQPAHFSRGYAWSALFLIGAPWLFGEARLRTMQLPMPRRVITVLVVCLVFLADNLLFMGMHTRGQWRGIANCYWLSPDKIAVLDTLNTHVQQHGTANTELLICQEPDLAHLAQVYTPLKTFFAHAVGPAEYDRKMPAQVAYFHGEVRSPLLEGPLLVVASNDSGSFTPPAASRLLLRNGDYSVFEVQAREPNDR